MADDSLAASFASALLPEEPVKKPLRRVYITPPEAWSPDGSPYAPPGPAPVMPGLAEALSRATVLPPPPPAPPDQAMPLGAAPDPRSWQYQPPQTELSADPRADVPGVHNLGYDIGRALESLVGIRSDIAYQRGEDIKNLLGMLPGTGTPISAAQAKEDYAQGNYGQMALNLAGVVPVPAAAAAAGAVKGAVKKGAKAIKSTSLPEIRDMPRDQAIEIARKQPHLIKAGEQSAGYYVGGPRNLQSRRGLTKLRKDFDAYVGEDPRGGDWYDRYRSYLNEVTGGNPEHIDWMRKQHGQWSAGVDPASEKHFVLKESNAALAGMPTRANYPAQHEAFMRAVAANDPNLLQLGDKTGEYAELISPIRPSFVGATGVNDFRHARNWGYTEPSGLPQKGSLTDAGHKFLDYETALAVDRANQTQLGGRSDWTGEQLQAAPWVRQKALDLMSRNKNLTYPEAFERANKTIADFADKHTAFATHEAQPGAAGAGHMPQSLEATTGERLAYAQDPRSRWDQTPYNRDAIYGGMELEGTPGVAMRVRPTIEMQGRYEGPAGLETNPGAAARPLVTFDTDKGTFKTITAADQAILNAGEATRAYIDAQNAGAWHKPWRGGPTGESRSLYFPMQGKATPQQLADIQAATTPHGLSDVVDTGEGVTATRFYPQLEKLQKGEKDTLGEAMRKGVLENVVPGSSPFRTKVDSDIVDYSEKWTEGVGSGAATRELLERVNVTPEIKAALNNNGMIAENALKRLERDAEWAAKWGAPREDIQNARRLIGEGPGWIDRLEAALKAGTIALPAVAAVIGSAAALSGVREGRSDHEGL